MTRGVNTQPSFNTPFTDGRRLAPFAVIAAAMLFGTTGTTRALGPESATTLGVGAVRLVLGAAVLAAGVAAIGRSWRGLDPRLVVSGGLAVATYQVTFFTGTLRSGVTVGTVTALATGPVAAGIIEAGRRRAAPHRVWMMSTGVAIAGVTLSVGAAGPLRLETWGIVAAVAAGASYAVYATTVSMQIARGADPLAAMAATFLAGAVMIAPLLFVEPLGWLTTARGLTAAVHLGVATVAVAYALFAFGLARLSVSTAVTLTLAEPVTAAVLGRVILYETLTWGAWTGVALVVLALALLGRSPTRQ